MSREWSYRDEAIKAHGGGLLSRFMVQRLFHLAQLSHIAKHQVVMRSGDLHERAEGHFHGERIRIV